MAMGISQRQLGILAGIDAFVASARVNQYEQGKHAPDFGTVARLARVLGVPVPYLFSEDDDLAVVIRIVATLPMECRKRFVQILKDAENENE